MNFFDRIVQFVKESRTELKKVVWPTRQETVRHTLTVIIMSGALALFLGGADYALQFILKTFIL
ncbi:MAG: preprotein translocase subunit SecE [Candidatus Sungbacteria bacterium]|nr:preprotein translocase subunit SecE [Candidatus Sungbacteria bacterium]